MAEVLLKVGTYSPGNPLQFQEGDILHAFNTHRCECTHAQHICLPRVNGAKPVDLNGFRQDALGLAQKYFDESYEFRFERVSRDEVKRITLSDLSEEVLSKTNPDPDKRIDVATYVASRLAYAKRPDVKGAGKAIFGTPGAEIWYGGSTVISSTNLTNIWNFIETQTPNLRVNFGRWNWSATELRHNLAIAVDDFTDAEAGTLTAPEYDGSDPPVMLKKRSKFVDFRGEAQLAGSLSDIDDRHVAVDIRGAFTFTRSTIVQTRT